MASAGTDHGAKLTIRAQAETPGMDGEHVEKPNVPSAVDFKEAQHSAFIAFIELFIAFGALTALCVWIFDGVIKRLVGL